MITGSSSASSWRRTGKWSLAPAYDITFAEGPGGEHATTIAGEGRRPGEVQLLALAGTAGLTAGAAKAILDEVRAAVSRWHAFADEAGVSRGTRATISKLIVPKR